MWYFDALDTQAGAGFVGWRTAQISQDVSDLESLDHPCFFVRAPGFQAEALSSAALAAGAAHRGFLPALLNGEGLEQSFSSLDQASEFLRRAYVQGGSDGNPEPGGDGPGFPPSDGDGGPSEGSDGAGLLRALQADWKPQGGELNWGGLKSLSASALNDSLGSASSRLLNVWVDSQPMNEAQALRWLQGALELAALTTPMAIGRSWRKPFRKVHPGSPLWSALPVDVQRLVEDAWHWHRHPGHWPLMDWPLALHPNRAQEAWALLRRQPCPSALADELMNKSESIETSAPANLQQALLRFLARPTAFEGLSSTSEAMLLWAAAAVACQSLGPIASRDEVRAATLEWLRQSLPRFAFDTETETLLARVARPDKPKGAPV